MTRFTTKTTHVLTHILVLVFAVTPALAAKIVIYGTGANGAQGNLDPHYQLISAPAGVTINVQACESNPYSAWAAPPPGLSWDIPACPLSGEPIGYYVYETTFSIPPGDPTTAVLQGYSSADDSGEIWLNGVKATVTGGYAALVKFKITDGMGGAHFQHGLNKLDFRVYNAQSITGLLVEISGYLDSPVGGTWQQLATPPSCAIGATLLLTDGRVLAHCEQQTLSSWYTLTPSIYGDYSQGKWNAVASMPTGYAPLYFASAVLPDGKVIVEGGEYNLTYNNLVWTNRGALFDPLPSSGFGKWTPLSTPPLGWQNIGDAQSVVLPGGTFMLASCCNNEAAETSDDGATWTQTGLFKADSYDEEGWTLLPSADEDSEVVLTVDTNVGAPSTCPGPSTASEVYVNGYWFCKGNTPVQLWDNLYVDSNGKLRGYEMGPAVLRPDGTVFQAGANAHNLGGPGSSAIFDSNTFTWKAGPDFICGIGCLSLNGLGLNIADGPAALLPNGNVLMLASPQEAMTAAVFFELQYGSDQLVNITAPHGLAATSDSSFYGHMLVLPTGQILFTDFSTDVEIYTPTYTRVDPSWRPRINSINFVTCGSSFSCFYTIHNTQPNIMDGYQLNGMSQGAAYGDDYQSATNYPLVRLTEVQLCPFPGCTTPPKVYYCRTHDHSSMGVATGNRLVSTTFDCPSAPTSYLKYRLEVVANGISGSPQGAFVWGNVVVAP